MTLLSFLSVDNNSSRNPWICIDRASLPFFSLRESVFLCSDSFATVSTTVWDNLSSNTAGRLSSFSFADFALLAPAPSSSVNLFATSNTDWLIRPKSFSFADSALLVPAPSSSSISWLTSSWLTSSSSSVRSRVGDEVPSPATGVFLVVGLSFGFVGFFFGVVVLRCVLGLFETLPKPRPEPLTGSFFGLLTAGALGKLSESRNASGDTVARFRLFGFGDTAVAVFGLFALDRLPESLKVSGGSGVAKALFCSIRTLLRVPHCSAAIGAAYRGRLLASSSMLRTSSQTMLSDFADFNLIHM
jgi:hypothetical protein